MQSLRRGASLRTTHSHPSFFFNDTATTEIYTLSLHDALPIWERSGINTILHELNPLFTINVTMRDIKDRKSGSAGMPRPISYAVFCLKKKNIAWRPFWKVQAVNTSVHW